MCKCTPNVRTLFCGKPGCEAPAQPISAPTRYDMKEQNPYGYESWRDLECDPDGDWVRWDDYERLQAELLETKRELQREVGTRAARVAEIDNLRRQLAQAGHRESAFRQANGLLKAQLDAFEDCIGVKDGQSFGERAEELIVTEVNHENLRRATAEPPAAPHSVDHLTRFTEWLMKEMPAGTVIGDPAWWARKLLAAACVFADEAPDCKQCDEHIGERDHAQDALQEAHIALGGDGEWVARMPSHAPPDSGDLHLDVPELARERMAELERLRAAQPLPALDVPDGWCPICGGQNGEHKPGCQDGSVTL